MTRKEKINNYRFLKRVYRVTVKQKNRTFGHHKDEIMFFCLLSAKSENEYENILRRF